MEFAADRHYVHERRRLQRIRLGLKPEDPRATSQQAERANSGMHLHLYILLLPETCSPPVEVS